MLTLGPPPVPVPLPDLGHCPFCGTKTPPSAYSSSLFGFPRIVCANRLCGCSMQGDALNRDVVVMWLRRPVPLATKSLPDKQTMERYMKMCRGSVEASEDLAYLRPEDVECWFVRTLNRVYRYNPDGKVWAALTESLPEPTSCEKESP